MQVEREQESHTSDDHFPQRTTRASSFPHTRPEHQPRMTHTPHSPHSSHPRRRTDGSPAPGGADALHIVWVTLASDGSVVDMPGWRSFTGQGWQHARGDGWLDMIHPDDRQRLATLWATARESGTHFRTTCRIRHRRDTSYTTYSAYDLRCAPVLGADGTVCEWVWNYSQRPTDGHDDAPWRRQPTPDSPPPTSHVTSASHSPRGKASNHRSSTSSPASSASTSSAAHPKPDPPIPAPLRHVIPIFAAMADAAIVYDTTGHAAFLNDAARALCGDRAPAGEPATVTPLALDDASGEPFAEGASPLARILAGAAIAAAHAVPAQLVQPDGSHLPVHVTGAPLSDPSGHTIGAAVLLREIPALHEPPTPARQQTSPWAPAGKSELAALIALAEAVIFVSDNIAEAPAPDGEPSNTHAAGHRLAALACDLIGCHRAAILSVQPDNTVEPVAVTGLDASLERQWWERHRVPSRLDETFEQSIVERLRADQVLLIDLRQPPYDTLPNPYGASIVLLVPMLVGEQLIGILSLDYAGLPHDYTLEEIALAGAVAKLAGLVIERERLLRERANAEASVIALVEAKRRMDEFLSIASHELRTPLTVIKANVQLLTRRIERATTPETDEQRSDSILSRLRLNHDFLDRTERQLDRLDRLISDLLDISRIEAGRLTLRVEPFELTQLVRDAVLGQRDAWPGRTITLDVPDISLPVNADHDRIGQVVTNLLTNALKYSPGHQPVAVRVTADQRAVRVAVRDHGPGLTGEQCVRLWERFHRVPGIEVQSGSGVGLGLGLYISKTIVERHDGAVGVESAPGEGSTFWFTLPLAQPD